MEVAVEHKSDAGDSDAQFAAAAAGTALSTDEPADLLHAILAKAASVQQFVHARQMYESLGGVKTARIPLQRAVSGCSAPPGVEEAAATPFKRRGSWPVFSPRPKEARDAACVRGRPPPQEVFPIPGVPDDAFLVARDTAAQLMGGGVTIWGLDGGPVDSSCCTFRPADSVYDEMLVMEGHTWIEQLALHVSFQPLYDLPRNWTVFVYIWTPGLAHGFVCLGMLHEVALEVAIDWNLTFGDLLGPQPVTIAFQPCIRPTAGGLTLWDFSWNRPALQSSVVGSPVGDPVAITPGKSFKTMTTFTEMQWHPWWALDMQEYIYVDSVRWTAVAGVPGGATSSLLWRLEIFSFADTKGRPRNQCAWRVDLTLPVDQVTEHGHMVFRHQLPCSVIGRFVRITALHHECQICVENVRIIAARRFGSTIHESMGSAMKLFAHRPFLGTFSELDGTRTFVWQSYRKVYRRADYLARFLAGAAGSTPSNESLMVAVMCKNRPEWVIADMACCMSGFTNVAVPPTATPQRLRYLLNKTKCVVAVCDEASKHLIQGIQHEVPSLRLVVCMDKQPVVMRRRNGVLYVDLEWAEVVGFAGQVEGFSRPSPPPAAAMTVLFTSGSTGDPKGAVQPFATAAELCMRIALPQPAVHCSFQPLYHSAERLMMLSVAIHGGCAGFARPGVDTLIEDMQLLEPTMINTVPAFVNKLYAAFTAELAQRMATVPPNQLDDVRDAMRDVLLCEFSGILGGRLQTLSVGSAPPVPAVMKWVHECFAQALISEGYGSTEAGTISIDNRIPATVEYKLVDVPELGYSATGTPPRGEIWVKTKTMISGYVNDPEATAAAFEDGYFKTGDIGEQQPDGSVLVVGRRKNTAKLSNGEFVEPERIETTLCACPLVADLLVFVDQGLDCVVAIVVVNMVTLRTTLTAINPAAATAPEEVLLGMPDVNKFVRAQLIQCGRAAGLEPYQVPQALVLTCIPFTTANGQLVDSGKYNRPAITAAYAEQLAALHRGPTSTDELANALAELASQVLGSTVSATASMASELGTNSLDAMRIVSAVKDRLGVDVPVAAVLGGASMQEIAAAVAGRHGDQKKAEEVVAKMARAVEKPLELDTTAKAAPEGDAAQLVTFVTGATGFIGIHVVHQLLQQAARHVMCLVRKQGDQDGLTRLKAVMQATGCEWTESMVSRIHVIEGSLQETHFGLSAAEYEVLTTGVGSVVHVAAEVNWLLSYEALEAANVGGTDQMLQFASTGVMKRFVFVSTISTCPVRGSELDMLSLADAAASGGYAASKWVAEMRAKAAGKLGIPMTIVRPAFVSGHSRTGHCNRTDFVSRYVLGCHALHATVGGEAAAQGTQGLTPVDFVAAAIVHMLSDVKSIGNTYHLEGADQLTTFAALALALQQTDATMRQVSVQDFFALLKAHPDNVLSPLSHMFGGGSLLSYTPWNSTATLRYLEAAGVVCPPMSAELVQRYVRWLCDHK